MSLVELWILAEKLLIPKLQKVSTSCLAVCYENTATGSPLPPVLLHECTAYLLSETYSEDPKQFFHEMLIDLVIVCSNAMPLHARLV